MHNILVTGADGQLGREMRTLGAASRHRYFFTDVADLEQLGFICTVQGKGCFVAEGNQELLRENQLCHIEELLAKAANQAEALGVTRDKLHEMLDLVAPETMQ